MFIINHSMHMVTYGLFTCYGKDDIFHLRTGIYQCVVLKCFCCRNVIIQTCYLAKTILDCLKE